MQKSPNTINIPLHDIKPLLDIEEYSFYYLLLLIGVGVVLLTGLLYLLYRYLKHKNRFNIRKEHLKLLHNIELSDAKRAAYEITKYGATFSQDSERLKSAYDALVEHLHSYKYKKYVADLDEETKHSLERYIGMIDV